MGVYAKYYSYLFVYPSLQCVRRELAILMQCKLTRVERFTPSNIKNDACLNIDLYYA